MNRLRILHVIDRFYPIMGYQESFLAREHSRYNETLVMTSDRHSRKIYNANKNLLGKRVIGPGFFTEQGIRTMRLPTLFDIEPLDSPWLIGLESAVTRFRPDVIIAHGIVSLTAIRIARLMPKLPQAKLILDDHMTYNATRGGYLTLLYRIYSRLFTPKLLNSVSQFVAVTCETKSFIEKVYRVPRERVRIIPLGVDRKSFHPDMTARKIVRRRYGIRGDEIVFIYAGKVVRQKGVDIFVEAGLRLRKRNHKLRFMIVGGKENTFYQNLKKRISNTGMETRYIFVDAVPNSKLYKYFSAADVGVWPLQCSISQLEATSCGLPTIISDRSGAAERVSSGNGLLYKESDLSDLVDRMTLLLNGRTRRKMSKKALAYAESLKWKNIAEEFLDLTESAKSRAEQNT